MQRVTFHDLPQGLYRAMSGVETYVNNCGLDRRLLELVRYRVSIINHCAYCLDMHSKEALHAGEEPLRLYSVAAWREATCFTEREQVALELAEKLTTLPDSHVDDEFYALMEKHFTEEEIGNLSLAIAQINSWNRLVQCFRPEPGIYEVKE